MERVISKVINTINGIDSRFFIFIIILINIISLKLYGNGEQYLPYAKQFADPDWMPNSFWYNDFPGTRILFELLFGWVLKYLSFEVFNLLGCILVAIIFTPILNKIFKYFEITNFHLIILLQVVYIGNQSLYAKGWMIGNIESKVFSYLFILLAFYNILKNRINISILFLIVSTYFHILVGGWYSAILLIWIFFLNIKIRKVIILGVIYIIALIPLILYLKSGLLNSETIVNGINTNWVYVFIRNPHHLVIFQGLDKFISDFAFGIIITLLIFILSIILIKKNLDSKINKLASILIVLISQQIIFIIIGYYDKSGVILKTYPYRTAVLTYFFFTILLFRLINIIFDKFYHQKKKISVTINQYAIILSIIALVISVYLTINNKLIPRMVNIYDKDILQIANYVKTNSNNDDVFLIIDKNNKARYFSRFAERDQFFVHKIIPSDKQKIYKWYKRFLATNEMLEDYERIPYYCQNYKIDYLITKKIIEENWLNLIQKEGKYYLYEIIDSKR